MIREHRGLTSAEEFQLNMHETIRCYVRELDGWEGQRASAALLASLKVIDRATEDADLADRLMADLNAKGETLRGLLDGEREPGLLVRVAERAQEQ